MVHLCLYQTYIKTIMDISPHLEALSQINYADMRGLTCESGRRATDEAILAFLQNLSNFFDSANNPPSYDELVMYRTYMTSLLDTINACERAYRSEALREDGYSEEEIAEMLPFYNKESIDKLPGLMQFWAAGENFADTIRNVELFRHVVGSMQAWQQSWSRAHQVQSQVVSNTRRRLFMSEAPTMNTDSGAGRGSQLNFR
jgi:hypothetical protein